MLTEYLSLNQVNRAVDLIDAGECVAFQTETVYGLGADACNENAVQKIYQAKGRPSDNPLIIHVSSKEQALAYVQDVSETAQLLMDRFWPGPLTLILNKRGQALAPSVTAGLETVGVRCPASPAAQILIDKLGRPIAAPSANRSGRPSPTTAHHVKEDLDGRIAGILDTGPSEVGLESTIIDCSSFSLPVILRPGGLSKEEIEEEIGPVSLSHSLLADQEIPMAPGMKYTHYSPRLEVYILDGPKERWQEVIVRLEEEGERLAVLADDKVVADLAKLVSFTYGLGQRGDSKTAASRLFDGLRSFDNTEATMILAQAYPLEGLGLAYMNRLEKAAGNRYL